MDLLKHLYNTKMSGVGVVFHDFVSVTKVNAYSCCHTCKITAVQTLLSTPCY